MSACGYCGGQGVGLGCPRCGRIADSIKLERRRERDRKRREAATTYASINIVAPTYTSNVLCLADDIELDREDSGPECEVEIFTFVAGSFEEAHRLISEHQNVDDLDYS